MQELITYGGDRRMVLKNGEVIRKPVWGDDWECCRIGIQGTLTDAEDWDTTLYGTPRFAFGLCSGNTNGYGSQNTDLAIGLVTAEPNWKWSADSVAPFFNLSNTVAYPIPFKKVGSTLTTQVANGVSKFPASESHRVAWILEIQKTSPYWTYRYLTGREDACQYNLTDDEFEEMMNDIPINDLGSMKNIPAGGTLTFGYNNFSVSQSSVHPTESSGNVLDHIFVYWSKMSIGFSFNLRHRKLL